MQQPLYRLAYCSRNAITGSESEIAEQIWQILEISRRKVLELDIAGALVFASGSLGRASGGTIPARCGPRGRQRATDNGGGAGLICCPRWGGHLCCDARFILPCPGCPEP